jgi:hypothetical protein
LGFGSNHQGIIILSPALAKILYYSPKFLDPLWNPQTLPIQFATDGSLLGIKNGSGVMLTVHLHLLPNSE